MRLHYLQHVWFEDLGAIRDWAQEKEFTITRTAFFENESLPKVEEIDWLIIMGGPMNIYEEDKYLWLKEEKEFIKKAINKNKIIIGICLGAQLIADVLGAKIFKNLHKEIGWFPVQKSNHDLPIILKNYPERLSVFHWHQDTFSLPPRAIRITENKTCLNQAFSFNNGKVLGFQYHTEMTKEGILRIIDQCKGEMKKGPYVQSETEILRNCDKVLLANTVLCNILNNLIKK